MSKLSKYWQFIIGGLGLLIAVVLGVVYWYSRKRTKNSGSVPWSEFWPKVLFAVISNEYGFNSRCDNLSGFGCSGKRYTDVLTLDSGTVGIAHFAGSGLCRLYRSIDTQQYFGRSQDEMCNNYASRSSQAAQNQFWVDGFRNWVRSPESERIQNEVFADSRQGAVNSAIANGWSNDRQMAIAVGVSNSFGNSGFETRARGFNWDAEKLLNWYANQSAHKQRRADQINKHFPAYQAKPMQT